MIDQSHVCTSDGLRADIEKMAASPEFTDVVPHLTQEQIRDTILSIILAIVIPAGNC